MRTRSILLIVIFIGGFTALNLSAQFWSQTGGGGNVTTYPTLTNSNVAIGTSSSTTNRLWTIGNGRFQTSTTNPNSGYIDLQPNNGSSPITDAPSSIEIGAATSVSQIDFKGYPNTNVDFRGKIKYTEGSGFAFQTAATATDRMVITENGTVGIGIVPGTLIQLQVEGFASKFSYGSANIGLVPATASIEMTSSTTGNSIDLKGSGHTGSDFWGRISYVDGSGFSFLTEGNGTPKVFIHETDGNVGIGTVSPTAKLHVNGTAIVATSLGIGTTSPGAMLHVTGSTRIGSLAGTGDRLVTCDANGTLGFQSIASVGDNLGNHTATQDIEMQGVWGVYDAAGIGFSNLTGFIPDPDGLEFTGGNGNLGIKGQSEYEYACTVHGDFHIYGDGVSTGGSWTGSDARFKKEITSINSALDNILKLRGTTYYFKQDEFKNMNFNNKLHYGLIAQELEKVYPEMVRTDNKGYKSVAYDMLIPVLIEGIKEQQAIIERQSKTITDQNSKLFDLEERLNKIEQPTNTTTAYSTMGIDAILYQNTPNPFNTRTQIKCFIPDGSMNAQIRFYDLSGILIETKMIGSLGENIITLDGVDYDSKVYVYSLYINDRLIDSKKMIVAK